MRGKKLRFCGYYEDITMFIPTILEGNENSHVRIDLYSRLLMDRIVLVDGPISQDLATSVCSQLIFLSSHAKGQDIYMYINSPGGDVTAGFAIYDTMRYISNPVSTVCLGYAASMGAFLLVGGEKGKRYSLPNSEILLHQPFAGIRGQVSDIEICAKNVIHKKHKMIRILSKNTGIEMKELEKITDRDLFITPEKAMKMGIIDRILENEDDLAVALTETATS